MACGADRSSPQVTLNDAYSGDILNAAKNARNDFEREVLGDGVIDRREYEEAVSKMVECAAQRGVKVVVASSFGVNQYEVSSAGTDVFERCSEDHLATIEGLYSAAVTNPDKLDEFELQAACLRRTGLALESFTGVDLRTAVQQGGRLIVPFDTEDERYGMCMTNPSFGADGLGRP